MWSRARGLPRAPGSLKKRRMWRARWSLLLVAWSACSAPPSTRDASVADPTWRSALYPAWWTPSFTDDAGRFLHDFSYAGYEGGAAPPSPPAGAPLPAPSADATGLLQRALDDGGVVLLGPGTWRIDGVLQLTAPHTVLRGSGVDRTTLIFTKRSGLDGTANVRIGSAPRVTGEAPLVQGAAARDGTVVIGPFDGGVLSAGDDVVVGWEITPGFVEAHGMTGTWRAFNDTWQPMFWRTVTRVEGAAVTLDVPLRSDVLLRDRPTLRRVAPGTHHVGVEHLSFTNAIEPAQALSMSQVAVFELSGVKDGFVREVRSIALDGGAHVQSGGVRVHQSRRVTVSGASLGRAQHRGSGGNGYLFEVRQSNEVLFQDCQGREGRHNFIQNWGFGTSGCVWQRVHSEGGVSEGPFGSNARSFSEFHHSLATANLIEDSTFEDGFAIVNRGGESTGAGHTGTQNVFWNVRGAGALRSMQFGWGYVIGTEALTVEVKDLFFGDLGTQPVDWVEGLDAGSSLLPRSLLDDQRARR